MSKFKVGDTVRRISGGFKGMVAGDTGRVAYVAGQQARIHLNRYGYGHSPENFELCPEQFDAETAVQLRDAAMKAVDEYNAYLARQPKLPRIITKFDE